MNAITFDTHKFVEKLKAAGVPDAQARARRLLKRSARLRLPPNAT